LLQYPLMGLLLGGGSTSVATRYFSRKIRAARSPKLSAWTEWASRWVPGTIPEPFHSSIWLVAMIQWKALLFCALREALLMILIGAV